MSALAARLRRPLDATPHPGRALAALGVVVAAGAATGVLATGDATLRFALVGVAAVASFGLAARAPDALLILLAAWLPTLGLARRVVELDGSQANADALILIAPVGLTALALFAAGRGAFAEMTALTKTVLALGALVVLGTFNLEHQTLAAGVAALIFWLTPMLAFWIGRAFCDDRLLRRVLFVAAGGSVLAAAYGIGQALVDFPRWDQHWIDTGGYTSLQVGDAIRPFASFSSAAEFGYFLAVGIVIWLVYGLRASRWVVALPVLALLLTALALESSRGVALTLCIAIALVFAASRGVRLPTAAVVGVAIVAAIVLGLRVVGSPGLGAPGHLSLIAHQLEGLAYPLDPERSTARAHLSLIGTGLESVTREPLGHGTATVTVAANRIDPEAVADKNTEADPGNVAAALGIPGLVLFALLVVLAVPLVYRIAAARRDALSVAALGIVIATSLQWLNGGLYAIAYLPWLVFGWADRPREVKP